MIRRSSIRLAAVAVATASVLSGCSTFSDSDVVAQVDGEDISTANFETLATEFFANPEVFLTTPTLDGRADADESRSLLAAMVRQRLVNLFLDQQGIDASEIRQRFKDSSLAGSPIADLSQEIQDLIADIEPVPRTEAFAMAETANIDELRALYADNPAKTGMICTRQILVDTEAEAQDVLEELRDGADFATLAIERSVDATAADSGGALASGDNQCIPLQTVLGGFDPAFVAGALVAREGTPSEPVESSFGWHVILHRPWAEVADSVGQLHQPGDSGVFLFDGYVATAEVEIDARFGSWDPILSGIVPIG